MTATRVFYLSLVFLNARRVFYSVIQGLGFFVCLIKHIHTKVYSDWDNDINTKQCLKWKYSILFVVCRGIMVRKRFDVAITTMFCFVSRFNTIFDVFLK